MQSVAQPVHLERVGDAAAGRRGRALAGALAPGATLAGGAPELLGVAAWHAEKASAATVRSARPRVRMVTPPRSLGRLLLGCPTIGVQRGRVNEIALHFLDGCCLGALQPPRQHEAAGRPAASVP